MDTPLGRAPGRLRNTIHSIAAIMLCISVPIALLMGVRIVSVLTPAPPEPSHSELVTTLLAGLTISIAVLAIVVAGLAIWGYQTIKVEARTIALEVAQKSAIEHLKGEDAQAKLRSDARAIIDQEFAKLREGFELAASQPRQETSTVEGGKDIERVGRPKPPTRKKRLDDESH